MHHATFRTSHVLLFSNNLCYIVLLQLRASCARLSLFHRLVHKPFQDCSDDTAEFYMTNDAVIHYYFSGGDVNKSIGDALSYHNSASWSDYDAVFANSGNPPVMLGEAVLTSAFELRNASVPFFWLSAYDGVGDINGWEASDALRFHESGARYVDISTMARGLRSMTKGAIEEHSKSESFSNRFGDPHFCLPGPPDEMALLLLKLMWALHLEGVE